MDLEEYFEAFQSSLEPFFSVWPGGTVSLLYFSESESEKSFYFGLHHFYLAYLVWEKQQEI